MQRLLIIQATLVLIAIIATVYFLGLEHAAAALFGGCLAMANSVLLYRKLDSASSMAKDNPNACQDQRLQVVQHHLQIPAAQVVPGNGFALGCHA